MTSLMTKRLIRKRKRKRSAGEKGQALLLVLVAMGLFLCAALGLALDASNMYAQRQLAQAAADAAAQAGMLSILDGTNIAADSNAFGGSGSVGTTFTCSSTTSPTPCYYAALNGFGQTGDTVEVSFPSSVTGVTGLATGYSPNLISVKVTRTVQTTLMQFFGPSSATVVGYAVAGILLPPLATPIIVTHPTLSNAFQISGGAIIRVTNGPLLTIQVNSCAGKGGTGTNGLACQTGYSISTGGGNGTCNNTCVDLSAAGPSGGAGEFGNWGEPAVWSDAGNSYLNPSTAYVEPSSAESDPLSSIAAPSTSGRPVITNVTPSATAVAPNPCIVLVTATGGLPASPNACQGSSTFGCPGSASSPSNNKNQCYLYYAGYYSAAVAPNGISVGGGNWALFAPGLYYIASGDGNNYGLQLSPANASMATGVASSTETGTGMTVFLTGDAIVNLQGGSNVTLLGDTLNTTFGGMLFFKDRADTGGTHHISGGSGLSLTGTIYLTRDNAATNASGGYNVLNLAGGSGSTTNFNGEVIVDTLDVNGGGTIQINLLGTGRDSTQIALVQ